MKFLPNLLFLFLAVPCSAQQFYLLTGSYDSPDSNGIHVYLFKSKDGSSTPVSHRPASNTSYLAVSPDEKFVYAVHETGDKNAFTGAVSAFLFDQKKGTLQFLNKQPVQGNNPCYISTDQTGRWVFAANYSSGNLVLFPVQANGFLGSVKLNHQYTGSGPVKERQASSHIHYVSVAGNNKDLWVTDLGSDRVFIEHFHEKTGYLFDTQYLPIVLEPGAGPRHLEIDPQRSVVYILEELSGTVAVYSYPGRHASRLLQRIHSTPGHYTGKPASADIHLSPDGRFLYSSNRGESNSIAIFETDRKTGTLTLLGHQSSLGISPRNFSIDPSGNFLLVANQHSNEIVIFKRNKRTGLLIDTGNRISVPRPVCLKWISVK